MSCCEIEITKEVSVVEVTSPGPQGPPGTGGGGSASVLVTAGAALGGGRFLHILPNGTAVYADASIGRPAHGFTQEAVASGDSVLLRTGGTMTGLSGLTPGAAYWLSATTPGGYSTTPPTSGFVQPVGYAVSADTLLVDLEPRVVLA